MLTVQPRGDGLVVVAVNDREGAWSGAVSVQRCTFAGDVLAAATLDLCAPARGNATLAVPARVATPGDARAELLVVHSGERRALWYFREDRDLALPAPAFDVTCARAATGYLVHVSARSLLRDLAVLADKVAGDAQVDDMLVTLLPTETVTFSVTTSAQVDPSRFAAPGVLRSANELAG